MRDGSGADVVAGAIGATVPHGCGVVDSDLPRVLPNLGLRTTLDLGVPG